MSKTKSNARSASRRSRSDHTEGAGVSSADAARAIMPLEGMRTRTRPKIGWDDSPAFTEESKKTLRAGVRKAITAQPAKSRAAAERLIQYAEYVAVPDRVWEQTVIPFWDAYRAMTEGKYSYLFRELGDLSTRSLKRDVDTANNVVEAIEDAMRLFQDHIQRKWKEHQRCKGADRFFA